MKINMNSLRTRLTFIFVGVALVSCVGLGGILYTVMSDSVKKEVFNQLEAVADSRSNHIADNLGYHMELISTLSQGNKLSAEFAKAQPSREVLQEVVEKDSERTTGLLDIFILDKSGMVIASTAKEQIGLDRSRDPYFTEVVSTLKPYFKDVYKSDVTGKTGYAVSAPVFQAGSKNIAGIYVARVDLGDLNKIVKDDTGMGKTGESYLVDEAGLMITESRLSADAMLLKKAVNEGITRAFATGLAMGIFKDYRGEPVLGYYSIDKDIVEVTGKKWCSVVEIDLQEAFAPIYRVRNVIFMLTLIFVAIVIFIGILVSNSIAKPLEDLSGVAVKIAKGDLTADIFVKSKDEVGLLAGSFKDMVTGLRAVLTKIQDATTQITSASSEILASSQEQASGAREQSSAVAETTSAAKELSLTSEQVGDSIKRVSVAATHALAGMAKIKEAVAKTSAMITSLGEKSQQIGKITELIDDVADQTNLLAVNASIEAARAGEQGRGFTVVADEIRKLADSSAKSTKDITALIEIIQHEMSNSVMAMETSVTSIDEEAKLASETADSAKEIAMSTTQQISGSKQIADAMSNIDEAMKQIAAGAAQSQAAVKQLTGLAKELKDTVGKFKIN